MKVHRTVPDHASAWKGDHGTAFSRQQRAHHTDRRAHPPHQFIGCLFGDVLAPDAYSAGRALHLRAEGAQDLDHVIGIRDIRHPADDAILSGENGGGQNRQRGVF